MDSTLSHIVEEAEVVRWMTNSLRLSWTWLHERGPVWKVQSHLPCFAPFLHFNYKTCTDWGHVCVTKNVELSSIPAWWDFLKEYIACWPVRSNGFNPIRMDLRKQASPFKQCSKFRPLPKYVFYTTLCLTIQRAWHWKFHVLGNKLTRWKCLMRRKDVMDKYVR